MTSPISTISGVKLANIGHLNDVDYTGWQEEYSINFSDVASTGAMSTGDTVTINGVDWEAGLEFSGYTSGEIEIVNGSGLEIVPAAYSNLYSADTYVPILSASISDMLGETPNKGDILCLQYIIAFSGSDGQQYAHNSYEAGGGMFWNGTRGGDQRWIGGRMLGIGGNPNWGCFVATTNQLNVSLAGYDDHTAPAWETVFQFMGQSAIVSSGPITDGAGTLEPPLQQVGSFSDGSPTRYYMDSPGGGFVAGAGSWTGDESNIMGAITPANAGIMLYAQKYRESRTFKTTFKDFRLFRARRHF